MNSTRNQEKVQFNHHLTQNTLIEVQVGMTMPVPDEKSNVACVGSIYFFRNYSWRPK